MPELPEVETTARGLRARIVGLRVERAWGMDWPRMLPNAAPAEVAAALSHRTVEGIERRGKYLVLAFDSDLLLALHRKMSGNVVLQEQATPPPPHTHLVLDFLGGTRLVFVDARKFGRIHLFTSRTEIDGYFAARLGPEPLDDVDGARLTALIGSRRGRIKSLLLDQAFLAGVGNLYADEALWEARIHPERPASSLSAREIAGLAEAIARVLASGIERRGTSFSSYRDAEGRAGQNQDYLNAYGRGPRRGHPARPCPRCGTLIQRLTFGQRGSHYCPTCQPAGA